MEIEKTNVVIRERVIGKIGDVVIVDFKGYHLRLGHTLLFRVHMNTELDFIYYIRSSRKDLLPILLDDFVDVTLDYIEDFRYNKAMGLIDESFKFKVLVNE